jgi:hypothetical protein
MGAPLGSLSVDGYLGGLLMFLYRSSRRYLLFMVLSALAVGAIVYFFVPRGVPVYGGKALIRLGAVDGTTLMKAKTVIASMNTLAFREQLARSASRADAKSAEPIADSLTMRSDGGDLITIDVRLLDEQQVRQTIDTVVRLLNEKEEKLREPLLAGLNGQAAILDDYIASLSRIQDRLVSLANRPVVDATPPGDVNSPSVPAAQLMDLAARNALEQRKAKSERLELQQRLGPAKTYRAEIVDDVRLSLLTGPARPWRTSALAAVITLVGFLIFALMPSRRATVQN